ncbi:MAG TPA: AAA family ATPase [Allosphingosinicella sp.]|jgi:exopolysaccharide/PEP-CTERM locus tyrosine autokinase
MNKPGALSSGSLIERAAELYGFGFPAVTPLVLNEAAEAPRAGEAAAALPPAELRAEPKPLPRRTLSSGPRAEVDRDKLRAAGFMDPASPVGALAEELRIVKRQLLATAAASAKAHTILICSAKPDEGKTFCAVNLALSLAGERDVEVLLVDADFPKPEVLSILGIEAEAGLVDALADPAIDPESLIVRTDIDGLSVLPAGRQMTDVTELLASERTREIIAGLARPNRIILFDSPPALMASPATVLATHAGQLLMVVRADRTTEADLREAVALLSGCDKVSLLLNGTGFAASGHRFGSYYGYGQ